MKRLREFLESIVFAGLKPSGQKAQPTELKWLGPIRGPIERFLAGGAPTDPLYLTNRSTKQKVRSWMLIGVPCLILAIVMAVALSNIIDPPEVKPAKELTAKEIAAKTLVLDKDIKIATNPDITVTEVAVRHDGGDRLAGVVKNLTSHEVANVDLTIDLTDNTGSQVGAVSGTVEKVPASNTKAFSFPIKQRDAAFALVREINSR
jgi:hypothetical protein